MRREHIHVHTCTQTDYNISFSDIQHTLMYTYICRDTCSPVVCCCFDASVIEDEVEANSPTPLTSAFERGEEREKGRKSERGREGGGKVGREMKYATNKKHQ